MARVLCLVEEPCVIETIFAVMSEHEIKFADNADRALEEIASGAYDIFIASAFLRCSPVESILLALKKSTHAAKIKIICIRDVMTPLSIASDRILAQTTMAVGASSYMSLDRLLKRHQEIFKSACFGDNEASAAPGRPA